MGECLSDSENDVREYREQRCWEKRHQTKEKMNGIMTHILRFPPGARVTLTNRRLYCALFPGLLVMSSLMCVAGWTDSRWRVGYWSVERCEYSDCADWLSMLQNSFYSFQTPRSISSIPRSLWSRPFPVAPMPIGHLFQCRQRWRSPTLEGCYCRFDSFSIRSFIRLPIRSIAIHPSKP
jgi:hypothetical protein